MKIGVVGDELFRADGRTDGHKDWYDEANRRNFSNAPNKDIRKMSDDTNDDKYE
jgi:hypothetical protein